MCFYAALFKQEKSIDLIEINDPIIFQKLQNEYVYFGRDTCNQCKEFEANIDKFNEILPSELYYFNTDYWRETNEKEFKNICNKYEVTTVPKIVFIKEGKYMGELDIEEMIEDIR